MSLKSPNYIPIDVISQARVHHEWNDNNPFDLLGQPNEAVKNQLKEISNFGAVAFTIGCAEWVVYRFSEVSSDRTPYDFLEACWVFVMGQDEALPPESDHDNWVGPIRGSINLSLMMILNTWFLSEDGPPAHPAAFAAQIPLHVMDNSEFFLEWQKKVIARLKRYFPINEQQPDGLPVPREILDYRVSFDFSQRSSLINIFLSEVDFKANKFIDHLAPPKHDS